MGRHSADGSGAIRFGASGVSFHIRFKGSDLSIILEDEGRQGSSYNYFTVVVDGETPGRFRTMSGVHAYRIAAGLSDDEHTVILSKATEGQNGWNKLIGFKCEALLQYPRLPDRKIEYIGDSITCGFGLDESSVPCGSGTWFDQHHAWLTYGALLARTFNAQWSISAVSGIGMIRNWNTPEPVMPDIYNGKYMDFADADAGWNHARYRPDLIVIGLGTNDFSDGDGENPRLPPESKSFVEAYIRFVNNLRSVHPGARFILLSSPVLEPEKNKILEKYIEQILQHLHNDGFSGITGFSFPKRYTTGCSGHPGRTDHIEMARVLEPYIRELMNW